MAERVRVRRLNDDEGRQLQRIVRRGGGSEKSIVKWRRAMVVLASPAVTMSLRSLGWCRPPNPSPEQIITVCRRQQSATPGNGLLRQWFPRSTDFYTLDRATIADVQMSLNDRPRHTLGFRTPASVFAAAC